MSGRTCGQSGAAATELAAIAYDGSLVDKRLCGCGNDPFLKAPEWQMCKCPKLPPQPKTRVPGSRMYT